MLLTLALGFGLGVLATVLAGEMDKKRQPRTFVIYADSFGTMPPCVFGDVSLTKCSEPTYGRFQDHT